MYRIKSFFSIQTSNECVHLFGHSRLGMGVFFHSFSHYWCLYSVECLLALSGLAPPYYLPIDACLVPVTGLDEGSWPRRHCSPWLRRCWANLRNLKMLLRAPRSTEPQAPTPARTGLVNSQILANKTLILRDFFSSHGLDFLCVIETWIGAGECSILVELLTLTPHGRQAVGEERWLSQRLLKMTLNVSSALNPRHFPGSKWLYLRWVTLTRCCALSSTAPPSTVRTLWMTFLISCPGSCRIMTVSLLLVILTFMCAALISHW